MTDGQKRMWVRASCRFASDLSLMGVMVDYFQRVGAQGYADVLYAIRKMVSEGEIPLSPGQSAENLAARISLKLGFKDVPGQENNPYNTQPLSITYDDDKNRVVNYGLEDR